MHPKKVGKVIFFVKNVPQKTEFSGGFSMAYTKNSNLQNNKYCAALLL